MAIIQDAATGRTAAVSSSNRLSTDSVATPVMANVSRETEQCFVFASGEFTDVTTLNTETGFLYIKNNSTTEDLHIQSIRTCGSTLQKWKLYGNITGGTLISGAIAGGNNNLNLGSSKGSNAIVYKGLNGATITGGSMLEHWINETGHSKEDLNGALILSPGDNITLTLETEVSGTYCARVIAYRD